MCGNREIKTLLMPFDSFTLLKGFIEDFLQIILFAVIFSCRDMELKEKTLTFAQELNSPIKKFRVIDGFTVRGI